MYALFVAVSAVGGAWMIGYALRLSESAGCCAAGILFAVIDIAIRSSNWQKIVATAAKPKIITRDGPVIPKRNPAMEFLELLLGPNSGGTFFHAIPAWLIGVAFVCLLKFGGFGPGH